MEKLSNPKEIIQVLQKHEFQFKKKFGQNFFVHPLSVSAPYTLPLVSTFIFPIRGGRLQDEKSANLQTILLYKLQI